MTLTEGTTHLITAGEPSAPGYCFTIVIILYIVVLSFVALILISSCEPLKEKFEPNVNSPLSVLIVNPLTSLSVGKVNEYTAPSTSLLPKYIVA